MQVEVLLKNGEIKIFNNVKYVTNASTNIPNDWIYIYLVNDETGKPSVKYPMSAVTCVAVGKYNLYR